MDPRAMEPYGRALQAFFAGHTSAELIVHRDDGYRSRLPMAHFFRTASQFSAIELAALERCKGRVLDVGAGSGVHSLVLQEKGIRITALDINSHAAEIMRQRRLRDVHCSDILEFKGGPFDTLLMMGHGIGIVETVEGLGRFLTYVRTLLAERGQVLLDSLDVRATDDPQHRAYHEANRQAGRYFGETRLQFEFDGTKGPVCSWLHIDPSTLTERAEAGGWRCDIILRENTGNYLARLTHRSRTERAAARST